jgi:Fe-S-cluster-containing dehydrogenase component
VSTACQRACGNDCITFGNVNDPESQIAKVRKSENKERVFYVLEQIHTLPNINYLSKVRNNDLVVAGNEELDIIMNKHI